MQSSFSLSIIEVLVYYISVLHFKTETCGDITYYKQNDYFIVLSFPQCWGCFLVVHFKGSYINYIFNTLLLFFFTAFQLVGSISPIHSTLYHTTKTQGIPKMSSHFPFILFFHLYLASVTSSWRPYLFLSSWTQSVHFFLCLHFLPSDSHCHSFRDYIFFHSSKMIIPHLFCSITSTVMFSTSIIRLILSFLTLSILDLLAAFC